jgi:hypothetical protein
MMGHEKSLETCIVGRTTLDDLIHASISVGSSHGSGQVISAQAPEDWQEV